MVAIPDPEALLADASRDVDYDRFAAGQTKARQALDHLPEEPEAGGARVRALLIIGRCAERLGSREVARAILAPARMGLLARPDPMQALELEILEAILVGSDGDVPGAAARLEAAALQARTAGAPALEGLALLRLGITHSWRGQHREALARFEEACEVQGRAGRVHRLPVVRNSVALSHLALGELDRALELFKDTLISARAQGNAWAEALALVNMAELFFESGDLGHALDLYRQALAVARGIGADRIVGDALVWIGQIHHRLGELGDAEQHLWDAITHHTDHGDGFQTAVATVALAEAALDGGRTGEAQVHIADALERAAQMDSGYLEARALLVRGRIARQLGDTPAAQRDLEAAAHRSGGLEERRLEVWARQDLAGLATTPQMRAEGLAEALALAERHGFDRDRVTLLLAQAEALVASGDKDGALAAYHSYVQAQQALVQEQSGLQLRQQQVLYALEQARREADHHRLLSRDLERANADLERLATTDGLTGLSNRRALLSRADEELRRARRYGHPLGVIVVDLDLFKKVNDSYGHDIGDQALVKVAAALAAGLRATDALGRMGGEEFCCVLPETTLEGAREVAERLRRGVEAIELVCPEGQVTLTASFGVAGLVEDDSAFAEVLKRADQALYRAKDRGRNRVES